MSADAKLVVRRRRRRRERAPVVARPDLRPVTRTRLGASVVLRQVKALLRKDLLTEWRTRETLLTLLFFALLQVVIFVFSLWVDEDTGRMVGPGVIWIALAFTGTLAIDRSFAQEQEGETLTALVLVPGAAQAVFIAKTTLNILYMVLVELMVVPLVILMLDVPVPADGVPALVSALVAGTVGFASVGTVFSAMLLSVRRRGVLLPIILYPITIPLLVMGVAATAVVVGNYPLTEAWSWIKVMIAADVLCLISGGWLFGYVTEDE